MSLMQHWPKDSDWNERLGDWFQSDAAQTLIEFVDLERAQNTIYPPAESVFRAFCCTSWVDTRVVVLGQDPYHGPGQAHGLSFSVEAGRLPPSLRNIFKELVADVGETMPTSGNLEPWARQGVLLLNSVMTVRAGKAHSHKKAGWESFTDAVVAALNDHPDRIIYLLWGKFAEKKAASIADRHVKIIAPHPSPLSAHRGFFGSRPFSTINQNLVQNGQPPIDWALE